MEVQEIPPEMVRHNSLSALGAFLPDRALANMDASRRAGHNSLSALGAFLPHLNLCGSLSAKTQRHNSLSALGAFLPRCVVRRKVF